MSRSRSQPSRNNVISLPPVFATSSKARIKTLKSVYGKQGMSNRKAVGTEDQKQNDERLVSSVSRSYTDKNSNRINLPVGRDPTREKIDDLRQELFEMKKMNANLKQRNKLINTQLNRLLRESEQRENHLQSILANKFQPAEVKDTNLAVTLTALKIGKLESEEIVKLQAEEIRTLQERIQTLKGGESPAEFSNEEQEGIETTVTSSRLPEQPSSNDTMMKHRHKMEIAKAHIVQNKKLKERLRLLEKEVIELRKQAVNGSPNEVFSFDKKEMEEVVSRIKENMMLSAVKNRTMNEPLEKAVNEPDSWPARQKELQDKVEELSKCKQNDLEEIHHLRLENEELRKELEQNSRNYDDEEQQPSSSNPPTLNSNKGNTTNYQGLFYGASFEDTDISPSLPSVRPDYVPPLDMRAVSASTSPEQRSVNSHLTNEDEAVEQEAEETILKSILADLTVAHIQRERWKQKSS